MTLIEALKTKLPFSREAWKDSFGYFKDWNEFLKTVGKISKESIWANDWIVDGESVQAKSREFQIHVSQDGHISVTGDVDTLVPFSIIKVREIID